MTATDVVTAFIDNLNAMRMDDAFALLAEDIVYHNIPMKPVTGPAAVKAVFDQIPFTAVEFITHHSAEHDHRVLNERTDRFRLADGRWVELRVMGVFEVLDGKITAWRDYFDLGQWMAQLAPQ
ncbi:MAG: limonene-1,2-epoxide hydrolase family protein [Sandaracinobacter sp.]|jgi:limonene-1,2-epoxide hydrolase